MSIKKYDPTELLEKSIFIFRKNGFHSSSTENPVNEFGNIYDSYSLGGRHSPYLMNLYNWIFLKFWFSKYHSQIKSL
jgi:hypothetical protein